MPDDTERQKGNQTENGSEHRGGPKGPEEVRKSRGGKVCPLTGRDRGPVILGVILILLGTFFLIAQWVPGVREWLGPLSWGRDWPLIVIGLGVLQLVMGVVQGVPGMAVPFAILTGVDGILYWQNLTGNWGSWSYIWSLIPGFLGGSPDRLPAEVM